jgi:hypothetical protein
MDVGTKSHAEKEKGEASDSFKRACFSHGIGRELYTAPFIWVSASKANIQKRDDKYTTYDKFRVNEITYNDNREITGLTIINQDGKTVYSLIDKASNIQKQASQGNADGTDVHTEEINKELLRTGVALDTVLQRYGVTSIQAMDDVTYKKAMSSLKRTKSKVA